MKKIKKALSLVLCLIMLVCMAVPSFAADKKAPIILVNDINKTNLYDKQGKQVYPFNYDKDEMTEKIKGTMPAFIYGVATGDYRSWISEFKSIMDKLYAPLALDKNGNPTNGTHSAFVYNKYAVVKNGDAYYDYSFFYDWRLSPLYTADLLKDYIDAVIFTTGSKKVSLVGNGYGSTVILSYLEKYGCSKVDTTIFNSSVLMGTEVSDAALTGKVKLNPNAMLNYFDNGNDIFGNKDLTEILMSLFSALNSASLLGKPAGSLEESLAEFYAVVAPEVIMSMQGAHLSTWSMVSFDELNNAIDFVFKGKKTEYAGFIDKIKDYYINVQANIESTLKLCTDSGMKFANITKYDFASIPVNEKSDITGDDTVEASRASLGATCAVYGNVLSREYISKADDKYISSDHIIDASTCLFPDYTWFVKDVHHNGNPECVSELVSAICESDKQMTVFDNATYPQFLKYSYEDNTMSALKDPPVVILSVQDTINQIIRFAQSILNFLRNVLSKVIGLLPLPIGA